MQCYATILWKFVLIYRLLSAICLLSVSNRQQMRILWQCWIPMQNSGCKFCEATPTLRVLRSRTQRAALKLECSEMRSECAGFRFTFVCAAGGTSLFTHRLPEASLFLLWDYNNCTVYCKDTCMYAYSAVRAYWNNSVLLDTFVPSVPHNNTNCLVWLAA